MTGEPNQPIDVGVVAIGRNEGQRLRRCLATAVAGAVGGMVYVDSGSTDGSVELARSLGAVVVELNLRTPFTAARARNAGLAKLLELHRHLQYVQFIDGDCELDGGFLAKARAKLESDATLAVVCGRRRERQPQASIYNRLCDIEWNTPVGPALACGGDAMMRISALRQVGGYNDRIIAGEEPELCLRLRQDGWKILRLDAEMTLHDAAMTRFGQWWRRAVRAGHAYAEGAALHGRPPLRYRIHETRSNWFWGILLPLIVLAAVVRWKWLGLVPLALIPLQTWRIYTRKRRQGLAAADARLYAVFTTLGKFPQAMGQIKYYFHRITGRASRVIEYKSAATVHSKSIAYLAGCFPLVSETFVYREVRELRRRGWNVIVLSLREPREIPPDLADLARDRMVAYGRGWLAAALAEGLCHPLRSAGTLGLAVLDAIAPGEPTPPSVRLKLPVQALTALSTTWRLRQNKGPAIPRLHCHFAHAPTTVGMYLARHLRIPFSFTGHANDLFQRRAILAKKLRRCAFVACISRWHQHFYLDLIPAVASKSPVIRCGVDVEEFHPNTDGDRSLDSFSVPSPGVPAEGQGSPWPSEERPSPQLPTSRDFASLNLSSPGVPGEGENPLRVLCVCRLVEKKGVDTLLRAAARHKCRLTIVGDGDALQTQRLRSLAESLQCDGRVDWLGAVPNAQVRRLLAGADVFALPCRTDSRGDRDGIPVVLIEAMAAGLSVVSGDLPAIRELIDDGVDGLLTPGGDDAALAGRLEQLDSDPRLRRRLGEAARRKVVAEFSMQENLDRLEQWFGGNESNQGM